MKALYVRKAKASIATSTNIFPTAAEPSENEECIKNSSKLHFAAFLDFLSCCSSWIRHPPAEASSPRRSSAASRRWQWAPTWSPTLSLWAACSALIQSGRTATVTQTNAFDLLHTHWMTTAIAQLPCLISHSLKGHKNLKITDPFPHQPLCVFGLFLTH